MTKDEQLIRAIFNLFHKDKAIQLLEKMGQPLQKLPTDLKEKYIIYKKNQLKRKLKNNNSKIK